MIQENTDTPETNSKAIGIIGFYSCETVPSSLSRVLERERNEARLCAKRWRAIAAKYIGCTEDECNRLPWDGPLKPFFGKK
jgi:hypothetical protein